MEDFSFQNEIENQKSRENHIYGSFLRIDTSLFLEQNHLEREISIFLGDDYSEVGNSVVSLIIAAKNKHEMIRELGSEVFERANEIIEQYQNNPQPTISIEDEQSLLYKCVDLVMSILDSFPHHIENIKQCRIHLSILSRFPCNFVPSAIDKLLSIDENLVSDICTNEFLDTINENLVKYKGDQERLRIIIDTLVPLFKLSCIPHEYAYDFVGLISKWLTRHTIPIESIFHMFSVCIHEPYIELLFNFQVIKFILDSLTLFDCSLYKFMFQILINVVASSFISRINLLDLQRKLFAWVYGSLDSDRRSSQIVDLTYQFLEVLFMFSDQFRNEFISSKLSNIIIGQTIANPPSIKCIYSSLSLVNFVLMSDYDDLKLEFGRVRLESVLEDALISNNDDSNLVALKIIMIVLDSHDTDSVLTNSIKEYVFSESFKDTLNLLMNDSINDDVFELAQIITNRMS